MRTPANVYIKVLFFGIVHIYSEWNIHIFIYIEYV